MISVLAVASEIFPLVKTGGLADVVGALPGALRGHAVEVRTLVPGYPAVMDALRDTATVWSDGRYFGGGARLVAGRAAGLDLFVLDAPHLYGRPGNPYMAADGRDWADNPQRFAALAYAAAVIGRGGVAGYVPDVVHAHDWQTGLAPAYLALGEGARPASVFTLHNLAFQGQVPAGLLGELRLPARAYTPDGVEYYQSIGMLKAGLRYADRITTVSPSYAAEICTPAGGMGMDGLLRARADVLTGIINGIDTAVWDPERDPLIEARYTSAARGPRQANKVALRARFGLDRAPAPLFGVVSRMSHQKGLDVLLDCVDDLVAAGGQLAVVGAGDAGLQAAFAAAAAAHPGRVGVSFGYDEAVAHLMQAGCDAILVPSRFEPCGLTQLCALRYGAVPVVSRVGGLADTVIDANAAAVSAGVATGVMFAPDDAGALRGAIRRVVRLWGERGVWMGMQARGMRTDVGWGTAAGVYAGVYADAVKRV